MHQQHNHCSRTLAAFVSLWLLLALGWPLQASPAEFLEPEKAFPVTVTVVDARSVDIAISIASGYYLYREAFRFQARGAVLGEALIPPGKIKFDETFQKNVETHRGNLRIRLPVQQAGAEFSLGVTLQGCADAGLCYPPMTQLASISLAAFGGNGSARMMVADSLVQTKPAIDQDPNTRLASAPHDEGAAIDHVLRTGQFWTVVAAFVVMGLLLSLTPCVLPMLPILSSIIVGDSKTPSRRRSLGLAASYSLGMASVYTAAGVAAGLAGEGFAAALQTPWVLGAFAAVMVLLALSMFDVYELRLPAALQQRLTTISQRQGGGRMGGVFLMGGLSALIVSPCVSAPLAGALVFLSQTRDVVLGGSALFALSVGMSVPLLLLGASAGALLPRAGPWMVGVKRFFGLALLAVALWIVQPLLPTRAVMASWAVWLCLCAGLCWPRRTAPPARRWGARLVSVLAFAAAALEAVGALSGAGDVLRPWTQHDDHGAQAALHFQPVRNVAELDAALGATTQVVVLDFYADWCVSCKEMERLTFTDPKVAAAMSKALLLKADVTANTEDDKQLLKRFHLFGPPGTIFFDAHGRETPGLRVIGYQDAKQFGQTLDAAGMQ